MKFLVIAISVNVLNVFKMYDAGDVRLIGGQPARDGQYPFQVSLKELEGNRHFCGGSILNLYWIMTAAHCFNNRANSSIVAVAGTNYLDKVGTPYNVSGVFLHDEYQENNLTNDIAVLKIDGRIRYNIYVRPVALANFVLAESTLCTLSGWGHTSDSTNYYSNELLDVTVALINNAKCPTRKLNTSNFCTYQPGKRACVGDSGGPLICRGQQYGIVSWGNGCKDSPDVHTSVLYYREWIRSQTGT